MTIDKRVATKPGPLIAILLLATVALGCSKYPKATSRDSLDFIKQVYTACNTKNVNRLTACEKRLTELEAEKKISNDEINSFREVLKVASEGNWEAAQTMALEFAQDQVQ